MAKLSIEQTHALPLDEVRKRLQSLADKLSEKYGIQAKWTSEREADVKRTGVTGKIACTETKVSVNLDISFVLNPLKDRIHERVTRELKSLLGDDKPA